MYTLPKLKEPMKEILETINLKKAAENIKADLWIDTEKYSNVADAQMVSENVPKSDNDSLERFAGDYDRRN